VFANYYKDRKVLVTGHTGFKGSWLTQWLLELGAQVVGISLDPPTEPNLFTTIALDREIKHYVCDIRNYQQLLDIFQAEKPEVVFHLAAQPIVRLSYKEPLETYSTNVMGTLHVFEAARNTPEIKTLVNITSDKCYDNKEWVFGYRENDAMGGYDPYSSSKGCAELVSSAYRNSFFNPLQYGETHHLALASVRAGNVIGGGDWAQDRLVPDCMKAMSKGEVVIIRNPIATRPWQHVLEPLSGYLWLGVRLGQEPQKYAQGWNFGPVDEDIWNVEKVVREIIKTWTGGVYQIQQDSVLHEANLLKLDISKAHYYLGWKPVYHAEEAIGETVSWYRHYYQGTKDMKEFTLTQIKNYGAKAKLLNLNWSQ
jgi:CDP-glucose 4,6-dehydratase